MIATEKKKPCCVSKRMYLLVIFIIGATGITAPVFAQQPNIIVFYPDQLRSQEVGCYGNALAQTPNMDGLASSGIRFEYCAPGLPVCTPARACLLTGRMPFSVRSSSAGQTWMVNNSIEMHRDEISIAEALKPLGYTCGHIGAKWHVSEVSGLSCIPYRQGFDFFEGLNSYGKFDVPAFCDNDGNLQNNFPGRWNADIMNERAVNFITSNQNNPFYLNIWHSPPHAPRNLHWGQTHPLNYVFSGDRMYLYNESPVLSDGDLRPNVITSLRDHAKDQIREYNAMTRGIDDTLGQILTTLNTLGLADNTIIIVSADHGSQLGSHATAWETTIGWEKNQIYDESILVPLIVYDPRQPAPAPVISSPIPQMDIMPTIVELAGGTPPSTCQGRSFAPLITGQGSYTPRDAMMVQYNSSVFEGVGYSNVRALRTDQYKYAARNNSGSVQGFALFDLQSDPYEQTNLYSNPAYNTIRNQLHNRLLTEMQQLDDPLVVPPKSRIELDISQIDLTVYKTLNPDDDQFTIANTYVGALNYSVTDTATWLNALPNSGSLAEDTSQLTTIGYSTAGMDPGDYSATITVQASNCMNSPQQIAVSLQILLPGDSDGDGDIDQEDFGDFQACYTGSGSQVIPQCQKYDFDVDGDVDTVDFATFQSCMGGPDQLPGC